MQTFPCPDMTCIYLGSGGVCKLTACIKRIPTYSSDRTSPTIAPYQVVPSTGNPMPGSTAPMYRCANKNCCRPIPAGHIYFQVRIVTGEGETHYVPCCSESCALNVKNKNADMHRRRLRDVEHQSFQKIALR